MLLFLATVATVLRAMHHSPFTGGKQIILIEVDSLDVALGPVL
jgi:hypothetical protein